MIGKKSVIVHKINPNLPGKAIQKCMLKKCFGGNFKDGLPKAFPRTRWSWHLFTDALASHLLNPRHMSSESLMCSPSIKLSSTLQILYFAYISAFIAKQIRVYLTWGGEFSPCDSRVLPLLSVCSERMPILCAAFSRVSGLMRQGMVQNKCPIM